MSARPDFMVIGAMKCATSTLHEQLARQPGMFMCRPKEPNFFSDDDVFAKGMTWYASLFADAPAGSLRGESSTHSTKLPTHPHTVSRVLEAYGATLKLIYVMRHPVDRLVSHYVHEWTQGVTADPIDEAIDTLPELVDYGRYAMQLRPWLDAFGPERILPVFFGRLSSHPGEQIARIGRFLGTTAPLAWDDTLGASNVSRQRERRSVVREMIRGIPGARSLVRALVPEAARERLRDRLWRMPKRPTLSPASRARVEAVFDEDLVTLGDQLVLDLSCATFDAATGIADPCWAATPREAAA